MTPSSTTTTPRPWTKIRRLTSRRPAYRRASALGFTETYDSFFGQAGDISRAEAQYLHRFMKQTIHPLAATFRKHYRWGREFGEAAVDDFLHTAYLCEEDAMCEQDAWD